VTRRAHRAHSVAFKLAALARMNTAPDVQALARELDIERALLYRWQRAYMREGEAGLRSVGRPRPVLQLPPDVDVSAAVTEAGPADAPMAASDAAPARIDSAGPVARIAELERKIGRQQLELDFFRAALRHVRALRR
jgi:transposase